MGNDVIINKIETIERCINRIKEVYDDYKALNLKVVQVIIESHLIDFGDYIYAMNKLL